MSRRTRASHAPPKPRALSPTTTPRLPSSGQFCLEQHRQPQHAETMRKRKASAPAPREPKRVEKEAEADAGGKTRNDRVQELLNKK